ncbi:MAG TPA: hypothetical protein DIU00_02315 [Phycisphaerales bacterium]|nr:hypothetical protein [Phycisphaerales bacterium]
MKENSRANLRYSAIRCVALLLVASLAGLSGTRAYGQAVRWTGAGGDDNWSNEYNWEFPPILPGPADVAKFDATYSPGRSAVDIDFSIAGLKYVGNSTHELDLLGSYLQVDDFVQVGSDKSKGGTGAIVDWTSSGTGGTLGIGNPGALGTFHLGVNTSPGDVANIASLFLHDVTVDAYVSDLSIGRKTSDSFSAIADGTLTLGEGSTLNVGTADDLAVVNIGREGFATYIYPTDGRAAGLLDATLGTANFNLSELNIGLGTAGHDKSRATGTLRTGLGTNITTATAKVGVGTHATGTVDMDGGLLTIKDDLWIGHQAGNGSGPANGTVTVRGSSSLYVGTTDAPATMNIGLNSSAAGEALGLFSATDDTSDVRLNLSELNVGRHTGGGTSSGGLATGTLEWNQTEAIHAKKVYFGRGGSSKGILDVQAGETFKLGDKYKSVSFLGISYHDTINRGTSTAHLDLSVNDPFFEAYIGDDLSIGRKTNLNTSTTANGSLKLGSNSILHVGTANDPAVINIGMQGHTIYKYADLVGGATGVLDATQGTADFHLSELNVGYGMGMWGDSTVTGTLKWDQEDQVLDATNVYFGRGGSTEGILEVPKYGTLKLGSAADPVSMLAISYNDTGGEGTSNAHLDFTVTDPVFEAHIGSDLSIGRKTNQSGKDSANGSLTLSSNSTLHVGTTDTPAVVNIGMNEGHLGDATGKFTAIDDAATVDLHLSELNVGWDIGYGGIDNKSTATGTLEWNQTEAIDADKVYFGRGGSTGKLNVSEGGTFRLGTQDDPISFLGISYHDNGAPGASSADLDFTKENPTFEAHIADELSIGIKASSSLSNSANGKLKLGSNSTLRVGTVDDLAVVNVGREGYTNVYYKHDGSATGLLDATEGTAEFHLSELNVGRRAPGWTGSTVTGTLNTGPGSTITATTANIGVGPDATGTVDMAGGLLTVETINMGAGGTFNFTEGRLGIGTFNTYLESGSLDQQGGTLAPGFSPFDTSLAGIATINGDYRLASKGTLEIELFGLIAGSEYDQLFVNGTVNLNADLGIGGILDVELGFAPQIGDEFIILENNDVIDWDLISGTFAGLPEGSLFSTGYLGSYYQFSISYVGHTGNDVVITSVVPVPGASLLAGIGILFSTWLLQKQDTKGMRRRRFTAMLLSD